MKSSSVPSLLITLLRSVFKSEVQMPEILADLIGSIGVLAKATFNRSVGIESSMIKGFLHVVPTFLKYKEGNSVQNELVHLNAVIASGIFLSQACIMPNKLIVLYKNVIDNQLLVELCGIFSTINDSMTELHMRAIEVISTAIHPFYGDSYNFPWARGPHQTIADYNENAPLFEKMRVAVWTTLNQYDWLSRIVVAYEVLEADYISSDSKTFKTKCRVTKVSLMRILLSMVRTEKDTSHLILENDKTIGIINQALKSKDKILTSIAL